MQSDFGQYAAVLGPDAMGEHHEVECQAVESITTNFPTFDLRQAVDEAQNHMGKWRKFPPKIGGTEVKLLIGIASTQLAPQMLWSLPNGLCVYESNSKTSMAHTCVSEAHMRCLHKGTRNTGYQKGDELPIKVS